MFSGAINPARDLGPRLFALIMYGTEAMTSNQGFFWIPLFAPLVGGVIGALTYLFMISAHWPEEEEKETKHAGGSYQSIHQGNK